MGSRGIVPLLHRGTYYYEDNPSEQYDFLQSINVSEEPEVMAKPTRDLSLKRTRRTNHTARALAKFEQLCKMPTGPGYRSNKTLSEQPSMVCHNTNDNPTQSEGPDIPLIHELPWTARATTTCPTKSLKLTVLQPWTAHPRAICPKKEVKIPSQKRLNNNNRKKI